MASDGRSRGRRGQAAQQRGRWVHQRGRHGQHVLRQRLDAARHPATHQIGLVWAQRLAARVGLGASRSEAFGQAAQRAFTRYLRG